ncbi:MAG: hypothetical protein PWQ55_2108 [Chloroflexota bacterium]|nr:hypothetical protein [Chloroflexota bacterium]
MAQNSEGLSHDERSQLLVFTFFLVCLIALFLTTGLLLARHFPQLSSAMVIHRMGISPDLGVFLSMILFSAGLALTLFRAIYHNTLEFSYFPVLLASGLGLFGFLFSFYQAFKLGGLSHGLLLVGILIGEGLLTSWLAVRLIDWCDSLYGLAPFSIRKGLTSRQVSAEMKEDSLIDDILPKWK